MRSILVGVAIFVAASLIVALNVRHNEHITTSLFVPFARETPVSQPAVAGVESTSPDSNVLLSTLPIQLIGTIVRAEGSMATLRFASAERENVFVNSPIHDLARVTRIERERLFFIAHGVEQYIRIQAFDPSAVVSREAMNAAGSVKEFNVRRTDVDAQLANLPQLLMSARAEPVTDRAGHIIGFRIASMDANSFFKTLGLDTGDLLTEVNGTKLESVEGVMKLFEELRSSSMIQMKASRGGRDLQLTYLIR